MKKLTHTGNLIMIGFGIAILLMSLLVYKTTQQNFDLVTDNYYEKEMIYQDEINARENALPFDSFFNISKTGNTLLVTIPAQLSNQISNGSIYFYCPSNKQNDKQVNIENNTDGHYDFNTAGWAKTGYIAKVNFNAAGKRYYRELVFNLN